jgi:excisionase family DNA binding protein
MPPEERSVIPITPATVAGAAPADTLLVTGPQAARLLAVSQRTLWGLTDRGEVPCVRIGRAVRYAVADLNAYVERLRAEARADGPQAAS